MVDNKDAYKADMLRQELREKLLEAFAKNADKRATRLELEEKLKKIVDDLKANDGVTALLDDPRYASVEVRTSRQWLKDIEEEVASSVKKAKLRAKKREKEGIKGTRTRTDNATKAKMLQEYFASKGTEPVKLAQIQKDLGLPSQITQWLASLKLPAEAVYDAEKGNRRAGKVLNPKKVPFADWTTKKLERIGLSQAEEDE